MVIPGGIALHYIKGIKSTLEIRRSFTCEHTPTLYPLILMRSRICDITVYEKLQWFILVPIILTLDSQTFSCKLMLCDASLSNSEAPIYFNDDVTTWLVYSNQMYRERCFDYFYLTYITLSIKFCQSHKHIQ